MTAARVWREQRALVGLVLAYTIAVGIAEWRLGLPVPLGNVGFRNFYLIFTVAAVCYATGALLLARARVRDGTGRWDASWRAWPRAWAECRRRYLNGYRLATAAVACAAVLLLLRTYSSWKPLIPLLRPYGALDTALMQADRALHFGQDPWRLLQPLLGHPPVTLTIDLLYALWLPLNFAVVLWQAASPVARDRDRFLLSYALAWILLGTGAATLLSSAGPCYYGRIVSGPDPFAPLMAYLGAIHAETGLVALRIQENLWTYYAGREVLPLNGISAMPSLHVAGATLFALAGWRASRGLGIALTLYGLVVLVGSVHLGWHYAVDGYVAAAAAAGLWWMVGRCLPCAEEDRPAHSPLRAESPLPGGHMSHSTRLGFAALLLWGAACQPAPETETAAMGAATSAPAGLSAADEEAVRAVDDEFERAAKAGDGEAIAALYAPDATLMPPNEATREGDKAGQYWIDFTNNFTGPIELTSTHVEGRGDLAYTVGTYRLTVTPKKEGAKALPTDEGKYVVILKKQADGSWKMVHDIWNSNNPPAKQ